ncbi:MAG: plasmid mobilization relaxosome protein MobC [Oscillospiraceae bacterium]|jgi:hypothetical protein|nr:plasmid mobilization relaxosome protein MobC [Oscillospiraceae bacterium]
MFCFRLSEPDFERIRSKAERSKLSVTAFITAAALGKEIVVVDGLAPILTELKALGRNLNQLTTLSNMGKIRSLELCEVKEQFGTLVRAVTKLKGR